MKDHYLELYRYENWAMRKIIPLVETSSDPEAERLFKHILLARELWFNRVSGSSNRYDFDGVDFAECVTAYHRNQAEWMDFIGGCGDFESAVHYQTLAGEPFSDKLKSILTHVVNHSTYHRGQITSVLKGKLELASTDFIFFLREK